jgi:hypothetical protein
MNPIELGQEWQQGGTAYVVRQVTSDGEVGYVAKSAEDNSLPMHFTAMENFLKNFTQAPA